jgi:hypothetical protein
MSFDLWQWIASVSSPMSGIKIEIDAFHHRFGNGIPGWQGRRHKRAEAGFELAIKRLPARCHDIPVRHLL